jgi:hypothetical protein
LLVNLENKKQHMLWRKKSQNSHWDHLPNLLHVNLLGRFTEGRSLGTDWAWRGGPQEDGAAFSLTWARGWRRQSPGSDLIHRPSEGESGGFTRRPIAACALSVSFAKGHVINLD